MYETDRPVQLHGAVVGFEWQNPHSFLSLRVTDAQGHAVNYDLECASISRLQKMGWARDTFTPGSQVTATVALRRDDAKRGEVLTLTLQDGRTLQNQVGR